MLCGRKRKSKRKNQASVENFYSKGNVVFSSVLLFIIIPMYANNDFIFQGIKTKFTKIKIRIFCLLANWVYL